MTQLFEIDVKNMRISEDLLVGLLIQYFQTMGYSLIPINVKELKNR